VRADLTQAGGDKFGLFIAAQQRPTERQNLVPKPVGARVCERDVMCLGAQKAIAAAKRSGEILIFGFDGQKAAIEQI
jgi:ABC-type sugar transport system substrate-binding protein